MDNSFCLRGNQDLPYYVSPRFEQTGLVRHLFTGRKGGVSVGAFASLNLSLFTADEPRHVEENRRRVAELLDIDQQNMVGIHQVHGDQIIEVRQDDWERGVFRSERPMIEGDALVTQDKGFALMACYADCVPVFFLDPVAKAIGLAHAGWKGTLAKIAAKTVREMQRLYGSKPSHLLAAVGPSIGPCHYQVDETVMMRVKESFPHQWRNLLTRITPDGYGQLNLWEANIVQLEEGGIPRSNISLAGMCTFCHADRFFSHRAGLAGRQAALIMLK